MKINTMKINTVKELMDFLKQYPKNMPVFFEKKEEIRYSEYTVDIDTEFVPLCISLDLKPVKKGKKFIQILSFSEG